MIRPFFHSNLIRLSILLLSLILFGVDSIRPVKTTMKVHPVSMKRNITTRDTINSRAVASETLTLMEGSAPKKLRRLPHIFSKVLQLPFRSDADVTVEESSDCFRFIAETEIEDGDVRAQAVEIHPGVTKIVVRAAAAGGGGGREEVDLLLMDELEIDAWRFRLPATTRPELATAVFVDGELVVTVPKGGGELGEGGDVWGGVGRLVLVQ